MKLTVLNDNLAGKKYYAEHGLSFLIEDEIKILFDVGSTDIFIQNSKLLDTSLNDVDCVVLSHGHWDHGNGLKYIKNKKLICHPDCFIKRYKKENNEYIGLELNLKDAKSNFQLELTKKPLKISKNIVFL